MSQPWILRGEQSGLLMHTVMTGSVSLCVRMKDYSTLMQSLNSLGNVENMSVQRQDRTGAQIDEANAPAEYLHPGLQPGQHRFAGERLVRHTATHIGAKRRRDHVEFAYDWRRDRVSRGWIIALVGAIWIMKRIKRARR
jgi:hypothetical protein